jgi:hypothetical protein
VVFAGSFESENHWHTCGKWVTGSALGEFEMSLVSWAW